MNNDTQHKQRKRAWEQMITPRVSWEQFKRIEASSSSLQQAQVIAKDVMLKQIRKQKNKQST
jgi:hypothetical protein